MALPSLRGVGSGNTGSGTSITVTLPTHEIGDLLICQIAFNGNNTVTLASGWTLLREGLNATTLKSGLYYRVATVTNTANPTFTIGATSRTWAAGSAAWVGVDVLTGIASPNGGTSAATGTTHGFGTIAVAGQPNCVHVFTLAKLTGTNDDLQPSSSPAYTDGYEIDNGTTVSSAMSYRSTVGPAAPAAASYTGTVSAPWVSQSFILRSTEYATFRASNNTVGATATSQTITKPTGTLTDELIVLLFHADSATVNLTGTLNGWTQVGSANIQTGGSGPSQSWLFYRRAQSGDGATYTSPVISASAPLTATAATYYRVPTSTGPFDGSPTTAGHAAATAVAIPSITTTVTNTSLLLLAGSWEWDTDWSGYATNMIERLDTTANTNGQVLADEVVVAAGATGTRSVTPTTTGAHTLWLIALTSVTSSSGAAATELTPTPVTVPLVTTAVTVTLTKTLDVDPVGIPLITADPTIVRTKTLTPTPVTVPILTAAPSLGGPVVLTPSPVEIPILAIGITRTGDLALTPAAVAVPVVTAAPTIVRTYTVALAPVAVPVVTVAPTLALVKTIEPSPVAIPLLTPSPSLLNTITVSPDPVQIPILAIAVTATSGALLSPSPVSISLALTTPAIAHVKTLTSDAVAIPIAIPNPVVVRTKTLAPTVVAITLALPPPSLAGATTLEPSPVTVPIVAIAVTVISSAVLTPSPVVISLVVPDPTYVRISTLTPSPVAVSITSVQPLVVLDQYLTPQPVTVVLLLIPISLAELRILPIAVGGPSGYWSAGGARSRWIVGSVRE